MEIIKQILLPDNSSYNIQASNIHVAEDAPINAEVNDIWFNTKAYVVCIKTQDSWKIISSNNENGGLPAGGTAGQALIKVDDIDGNAEWQDIQALPEGGVAGQILTKVSTTEGDATWSDFPELNYLPLSGGSVTGDITAPTFVGKLTGNADTATNATNATNAVNATNATDAVNATNIYSSPSTSRAYVLGTTTASSDNHATVYNASVYTEGAVLYGAAWNDYAEYREADCIKPGYVVCENGDDTMSLSSKRLARGAKIISDTFGFAIGQTEKAHTPIAVAGRVLVYPSEDRNLYKDYIGYAVCSAPDGKISLMTEEEELKYPWAILGYVSSVPNYDYWGENNIKVDGRIWIYTK